MLLKRNHLLLIDLGLLEIHLGGSSGHEFLVVLDHLPASTLQKPDNLLYILIILLLRNSADAAAQALVDMIVQAWTELSMQDGIGSYLEIAGAQRIYAVEEFHKVTGMYHAAVRTKITGSVPDHAACQKHFREVPSTDTYPWIGLGILQENVVARLELLDQVVFKQQGIRL